MISFIRGKLDTINSNSLIIDCNGVGYDIGVGATTLPRLEKIGSEIKLHTYMQVRDDGIGLYGFLEKEELNMFNMLISVSGIGPKSAMNMLSQSSPQDLMLAIISGDVSMMSKFPGIGKKTAGRLILELKDKIKTQSAISYDFDEESKTAGYEGKPKSEAIAALCALGYSRSESVKAVVSIYEEAMETQQIIRLSLKELSRN